MMPSDFEWSYIRRYTLVPALCTLVAAAAVGIAFWFKGVQVDQHSRLTANQTVVQEDYDALVARRRIVDRYHRRYQQFSEAGFVGMESRLDWIETLRASSGELTLPRVSYVIEPQLSAIAPVESYMAGDNTSIHVSRLELEMSLIHEFDLLRFIDELQQNAPGLMAVDRCALTWQPDNAERLTADPNIGALCSIAIYSVITPDVPRGESS